jgi:hypothetical protein
LKQKGGGTPATVTKGWHQLFLRDFALQFHSFVTVFKFTLCYLNFPWLSVVGSGRESADN